MPYVFAIASRFSVAQSLFGLSLGFAVVSLLQAVNTRDRRLSAAVQREVIVAMATLTGVVGAVSGSAPTGTHFLDIAYCATFGFLLFLIASRLTPTGLSTAAIPAVVFMFLGTTWTFVNALATFAPLGAVVALIALRRNAFLARMATAFSLCAAVFYYPTNVRSLVPSAVAAAVTLALLVALIVGRRQQRPDEEQKGERSFDDGAAGANKSDRRASARTRRVIFGLGSVVVGALAIAGVQALRETRTTKAQLERTIEGLSAALVPVESLDVHAAEAALAGLEPELEATHKRLNGPLWKASAVVPGVAQNAAVVNDLIDDARSVVGQARTVLQTDQLKKLRRADGSIDVRLLEDAVPKLDALGTALTSMKASVARSKGPWVAHPIKKRAATFAPKVDKALNQVATGREAAVHLPELLGAASPRTYLLIFPTPSEARGSGGLIGNWGELRIDNGAISLVRFDRIAKLIVGEKPWEERNDTFPPGYFDRYKDFSPKEFFQNLLVSPDFPTSAEVIAGQYPESTGRQIDGVISVDPFGLAAFLSLEGPLSIPGRPEPITADNAARTLLYDLYVEAGDNPQNERVGVLEQIARGTFERIHSIPIDTPQVLVQKLGPAFRQRHIQMWSRSSASQGYLTSIGAEGSYAFPTSPRQVDVLDAIGLVSQNAGGNKIDWFGTRALDYVVDVTPAGDVSATVTIDLRNQAPGNGLPDYIIGNVIEKRIVPRGTQTSILSLYTRLELQDASLFGEPVKFEKAIEFGLNVYTVQAEIPSHSFQKLVIHLKGTAKAKGSLPVKAVELLYQPQVNPDNVTVRFGSNTKPTQLLLESRSIAYSTIRP